MPLQPPEDIQLAATMEFMLHQDTRDVPKIPHIYVPSLGNQASTSYESTRSQSTLMSSLLGTCSSSADSRNSQGTTRTFKLPSASFSFVYGAPTATGRCNPSFSSSMCQRKPISNLALFNSIDRVLNPFTCTAKCVTELAGLLLVAAPIESSHLIRPTTQACLAGNSKIRSAGYLLLHTVISHQASISTIDLVTLWKALTSGGVEKNRIARRRQLEAAKIMIGEKGNLLLVPGIFECLIDWIGSTPLGDSTTISIIGEILRNTVKNRTEYLEEEQLVPLLELCCRLVRDAIEAQKRSLGLKSSYGPPFFFPCMTEPNSTEDNSSTVPVYETVVLFSDIIHSIRTMNIIPHNCIPCLVGTLCLLHEYIDMMQSLAYSKIGPRTPVDGQMHEIVERTMDELLNDRGQGREVLTAIEDSLLRSSTHESALIATGAMGILTGIFWNWMSDLTQHALVASEQAPVISEYAPVISDHGLPKIVTTTRLDRMMQAMQQIPKIWVSTSEEVNAVVPGGERILLELVSLVERLVGYCEYDESSPISIFVGSVVSDLATIIKRQRHVNGTIYQMSFCHPDGVPSILVARIEHILGLPMESTIMQPPLDLILLSMPDRLCDPNLFRVIDHLQSSGKLDPRSLDWAERMRTILEIFARTNSLEYLSSRCAIASHLAKSYEDVVDLGHFHSEVVENVIDMWQRTLPTETDPTILRIAFEVLSKEIVLSATADDIATNPSAGRISDLWARIAAQKHDDCDEHPFHHCAAAETAAASNDHVCKNSRVYLAVKFLIVAFNVFAFKSPQALEILLTDADRQQSESAATMAVSLFSKLTELLGVNKEGKRPGKPRVHCRKARLLLIQWMMRLRAGGDHRIFTNSGFLPEVIPLARLVFRSGSDENLISRLDEEHYEQKQRLSESRRLRAGTRKDSFNTFIVCDLNKVSISPQPCILWNGPDNLLEELYTGTSHPSPAMTTFASKEGARSPYWLPVSTYVDTLCDILTYGRDWEVASYLLCHLPLQLVNKHFFCGDKVIPAIQRLVKTIYESIQDDRLFHQMENIQPRQLKEKHVRALLLHSLTVLISYRRTYTAKGGDDVARVKEIKPKIIETLVSGLESGLTTSKPCIEGLAHVVYALPNLLSGFLPSIVEKLSRLITNPEMAVHILEFLFIVGYTPQTWSRSFREIDYQRVFGIALKYIEHHYRPDKPTMVTSDGTQSFALAQHVLNTAFFVIHLWFLAIKVEDRAKFVPFIASELSMANQGKPRLEPTTEVCLDWLYRYAHGSADPKITPSFMYHSIVCPDGGSKFSVKRSWNDKQYSEGKNIASVRAWKLGNSIVTMAAMKRPAGWIRILIRRPSCITELICHPEGQRSWIPRDIATASNLSDDNKVSEDSLGINEAFVESLVKEVLKHQDVAIPDPVSGVSWAQILHIPDNPVQYPDPGKFAFLLRQHNSFEDDQLHPFPDFGKLKPTLEMIDRCPVIDTHKVAVIYVAPGQSSEREILGNQHGSPAYMQFLRKLGRLVKPGDELEVYTGGLQADKHGEYALAWWDDMAQIIYHVATMMPNNYENHIYKKQEIGNDAVKIIWNDSGKPYIFDTIKSQFSLFNVIVEPHTLMQRSAFEDDSHANGYFKVTMQIDPRLPRITPIGEFKIVLASQLPDMIRHFTLLASLFCNAWLNTGMDGDYTYPLNTNWQQRLQYISKSEKFLPKTSETA